jgi:Mrp family chromosome partitioning ATPase
VEIRQDAGHPIAAPNGIPLVAPGQTIRAEIVKSTKADVNANPGVDLSHLAILPWIEASSTLLGAPLHHAVTGPYYCDSVILQENYLPITVAAVPMSPEPLARPASANQATEPVAAATVASPQPIVSPQHKPLLSPKVAQPFTAVWEVDAFEFSDTVIALFGDVSLIKSIGFPLDRAVSEGLQTLLITSIEPGSGRTTIATGIAIAAATSGLRVALVDASMATAPASASADKSSLADALNLEVQYGWIEAIRGGISIAETAIHSIEDQLTVLPLVVPMAGLPPTSDEFGRMIETLRQSFDLIVIDGPPCAEAAFRPLVSHQSGSTAIDAAILVQDMRHTSADQANRAMETLRRDGITGLGMVQNFV